MKGMYEAVASTSDGTFRAYVLSQESVVILEDNVVGFADQFGVTDYGGDARTPESLLAVLISWVHENRRGLEISETRLTLGN